MHTPSLPLSSVLMGNYTNKCSLFSTQSDWKANEWIYQVVTFLAEGQLLHCVITEER